MSGTQQALLAGGVRTPNAPIQYGTFTGPASITTQDVTGLGYTPGLVIMWSNGLVAASAVSGTAQMMFGVAIPGGNKWSMTGRSNDNAATMDSRRGFRSDYALIRSGATDVQDGIIDTVTGISDGFRVNWAVASTSIINYMAFPPTLSFHVGTFDTGTSSGTQDITAPGFQPVLTLFGACLTNTTEGVTGEYDLGLGAGTSSTNRCGGAWVDSDGTLSANSKGLMSATSAVLNINTSGGVEMAIDYEGPIAGGFRIDVTNPPTASSRVGYVCIGGAGFSANVGTFLSKATTTGNVSYTGVGFQPDTMMYFGRGATALDSALAALQMSIGAAKSTSNRGFDGTGSVDASANSDCSRIKKTDKAYGVMAGDVTAASQEADLVSFDADGWTFNWTTVTGTQTYNGYIAMKSF